MRLNNSDKSALMSCFSRIDLPDEEVYTFIKNLVQEGEYTNRNNAETAFTDYCIHYCGSVFFMARLNRKKQLSSFDEDVWIEKGLRFFNGDV